MWLRLSNFLSGILVKIPIYWLIPILSFNAHDLFLPLLKCEHLLKIPTIRLHSKNVMRCNDANFTAEYLEINAFPLWL